MRSTLWFGVLLVAASSAPAAEPPQFIVHAADGATTRGVLRELKADGRVVIGDAKPLAGADLVSIAAPIGPHCILTNGDRLPITSMKLEGDLLKVRSLDLDGDREFTLAPALVAVYWRAAPEGAEGLERYRRRLAAQPRPRDAAHLRNGDVTAGVLDALDDKRAVIAADRKTTTVALDRLAALSFASETAAPRKIKGRTYRLILKPGLATEESAWLTLTAATCSDGATLEGTTSFGSHLRVPLERLAALDVLGGRAVELSDLKPRGYTFTPFLGDDGFTWPLVSDGAVDGGDLHLGGGVYPKGLGMHSRSRVSYDLSGGYRWFEATVGLDDVAGRRGSVVIRVLADGKPLDLGLKGELTGRGGPATLHVPVVGVKELTLEVDYGSGGDVGDHVDWVDARLVR
jgi:hypothetical protein